MRGTFWPVVLIVLGGLLLLSNLGILPLGELKALLAAPGSLPLGLRYEARLELARLRGAAGRAELEALAQEAGQRGCARVAARAQALLGKPGRSGAETRRPAATTAGGRYGACAQS